MRNPSDMLKVGEALAQYGLEATYEESKPNDGVSVVGYRDRFGSYL